MALRLVVVWLLVFVLVALVNNNAVVVVAQTCSWEDQDCYQDPALTPMTVDFLPDGTNETFLAYVTPDVSTFYREEPGKRKPVRPRFGGQFGKFINLSSKSVKMYWDSGNAGQEPSYIADMGPFGAAGTATFPGHKFLVYNGAGRRNLVTTWTVVSTTSLYVYDPFEDGTESLDSLTAQQRAQYDLQKNNLRFGEEYLKLTGREWLSLYPRRPRPLHPLWPADYLGQTHTVTTQETHFTELPPDEALGKVTHNVPHKRMLQEFRTPAEEGGGTLNMTMTVLSCAPRVFEVKNFLSEAEVLHILELATGMKLDPSSTKAGAVGESRVDDATRTSRNSWIRRERSPIIDAIYRRAADLMKMDESYLRLRSHQEMPDLSFKGANAEQLQLVHYDVGQQYTPHHDFQIPGVNDGQPMRFATILFYLNEGMKGGQTSFPRWLNAETSGQLQVEPEVGKAILFYNLLPDGNMDERSQHAALPVTKGEKWLINLWTWDPFMRFVY